MKDSSLPVRKAILKALKADNAVKVLVPASRIYPPQTPAEPIWPFIRYGIPSDLPFRASGLDGSTIVVAIHAFAKGPGEDAAAAIKATIARALDGGEGKGLTLDLVDADYPATAHVLVTGGQLLRDTDEADAWHGIVNLEIAVSS